jgi:hypothetical protein
LAGRRLTALTSCLLVAAIAAGAAQAQFEDERDTELTPVAKRVTDQWALMGGAKFGRDGDLFNGADSPTPFTVDFFSTSFSPDDPATEEIDIPVGFFGGAECIDPDTPFGGVSDEPAKDCARRPAIYRYRVDDLDQQHIERVDLVDPNGPDRDKPGFVGAIAWIDPHRALAVGGDGFYPRREPPAQASDAEYLEYDRDHWAGRARAWIYDDADGDGKSAWREVTDELPQAMGALTALDCRHKDVTEGFGTPAVVVEKGTCFAGGMQRLWRWDPPGPGGDPAEGFDPTPIADIPLVTPGGGPAGQALVNLPRDLVNALRRDTLPPEAAPAVDELRPPIPDFHYRVRQIRFPTADLAGNEPGSDPRVVAVTSGCCATADRLTGSDATSVHTPGGARLLAWTRVGWKATQFAPTYEEDASGLGAPLADSYYGFVYNSSGRSAIASPGGERAADSSTSDEPGSRVVATGSEALSVQALAGVRLLAGDGDFKTTESPTGSITGSGGGTRDGLVDWAVGRFKDSAQGVAYTTAPSALPLPNPLTCKVTNQELVALFQGAAPACEAEPRNVTDAAMSSKRLLAMGTYALNALSFVRGDGRVAWAAGDRGALARLGGAGKLGGAAEPDAPQLEVDGPTPLSDTSPFDSFRPPIGASRAGVVPPLADQPFEPLPDPALVPWGTADANGPVSLSGEQIASVAMSRDGSEGWAVGSGLALQHFDGSRWTRCDIDGMGGVYGPDPACEALKPLLPKAGTLVSVERIPVEHDDDPANDEDFELTAVGPGLVLRYLDGRWEFDPDAAKIVGISGNPPYARIAFRRPDDGWLASNSGLYRYVDGAWPNGTWVPCFPSNPKCGNVSIFPKGLDTGSIDDLRVAGDTVFAAGTRFDTISQSHHPFVLSKAPPKEPGAPDEPWLPELDPGCENWDENAPPVRCTVTPTPTDDGFAYSLSVLDLGDRGVVGWLLGKFGGTGPEDQWRSYLRGTMPPGSGTTLMRRDPGSGKWVPRRVKDVARDLVPFFKATNKAPQIVGVRGPNGEERAFILPDWWRHGEVFHPPLEYHAERDRWTVMRAPFVSSTNLMTSVEQSTQGMITSAAPDNQGGIWVTALSAQQGWTAGEQLFSHSATYFYRYAHERRREVFEDTASPVTEPITGLAGTPDGGVWVSTQSDRVYRYDRLGGWERARVKGWDRGVVVTKPSKALAVAVNDEGVGVLVGEDGRIGDLAPGEVTLDPASGRRCSDAPPPCGTPRDLRAAAVAPDGAAIVGGEHLTLMWRPAEGGFQTIETPRVPAGATVTGLSMPDPDHAWATVNYGTNADQNANIWMGARSGTHWRWVRESDTEAARDEAGRAGLFDIRVQADGRGLAVGHRGAMLERSADGAWRRIKTGFVDNLHVIAFPPSGYGDGVVVGGEMGVILTRIGGRYWLARQTDFTDPLTTGSNNVLSGRIVGLSLAAGGADGEVEAWAASQVNNDYGGEGYLRRPAPWTLLHYGSTTPLLNPRVRAEPLPDTPPAEPGEVTLGAFGRSECQLEALSGSCPPFEGTNLFNEVVTRGIQAELRARRERTGGAFAAVFTGDINNAPGRDEEDTPQVHTQLEPNVSHDLWRDLVARPLWEKGIPLFGALGKTDLSRVDVCYPGTGCRDTQAAADAGLSGRWRQTFGEMPRPWGSATPSASDEVELRPVEEDTITSATQVATAGAPEVFAPPGPDDVSTTAASVVDGGAHTHYALDMVRDGRQLARIVVIDNSFAQSLQASDPDQNPVEGAGGQAGWLERVLCVKGETCATGGSREPGTPAVVVSNAPTYSYGPGALEATQQDGSALETLLVRHRATAVVSGRLGWNGLYYTLAPGLHFPCPGGEYPEGPPATAEPPCSPAGAPAGAPEPPKAPAAEGLVGELRGLGAPVPPQADGLAGTADGARRPIPTVVASSAGGRFGPRGSDDGTAREGFWHGYSIVRVRRSGEVIVEQRPIFDWVGIEAQEHTLRAGQRLTLRGFGREPIGTDTSVRIQRIDSPAVTHRYDLVMADPEKPYVPLEDANGDYVPVAARVATVNQQTGTVKAGPGRGERTYAIGILSVGDKAATWPIAFEPRRSFSPPRAKLSLPAIPRAARAPAAQPPIRVSDAAAPPPAQPPATPASPFSAQTLQPPQPPQLPNLPGANAPPAPAPPQLQAPPPPPGPPAPPSVPPQQQPLPLSLNARLQAISLVPSVNPPAPPPVNPAPPAGGAARKEAKQRQAAAAKSEESGGQEDGVGIETAQGGNEISPDGVAASRRAVDKPAPATRRAPDRPAVSFAPLARREQPSAWSRGALYGGGLGLAGVALALGFSVLRPRPRRRPPDVPAPAWARATHRRAR